MQLTNMGANSGDDVAILNDGQQIFSSNSTGIYYSADGRNTSTLISPALDFTNMSLSGNNNALIECMNGIMEILLMQHPFPKHSAP